MKSKVTVSFYDKFLGSISPERAVKRLKAKMALGMLRDYEGAQKAKRRSLWRARNTSQNKESETGAETLRARARDLIRNNGWAKSGVRGFAVDLVGNGIRPKFMDGQNKITKDFLPSWKAWAETSLCDAGGTKTLYTIQRLAALTMYSAGEVLIRKVTVLNETRSGVPVPNFKLMVLEPEFLDFSKNDATQNIIQGVKYDEYGAPISYFVFERHPLDGGGTPQTNEIPATEIIHLFDETRPGQARGITEYDASIESIKSLDDYEDAGLQARKVQALLNTFITGVEYTEDGSSIPDIPTTMEPGGITALPAGVDVKTVQPPMMSEHRDYSRSVLHKVGSGLRRSYESLSGDLSDTNYSSIRAGRVEQDKNNSAIRDLIFIPKLCDKIALWFLTDLNINAPVDVTISWIRPSISMIDPEKEAAAYLALVRSGFTSLRDIQSKFGHDPEELLSEIEDSNTAMDKSEVILDSDPRKVDKTGKSQKTGQVEV